MNCKIDIKGLSLGEHSYDFKVDGSFFEAYENDTISNADLNVTAKVNKSPGWIKLDLEIAGNVTVQCDRCLADLVMPVHISAPFTVKFSSVISDEQEYGEDVIMLDSNDAELDLSQIIYDYVCLNLPLKKVHQDGECDKEMMDKMKDILK